MGRPKKNIQKLGIVNNYAGKIISINLKRRTYFGIGDMVDHRGNTVRKLWLSPEDWHATVPNNLTVEEAGMIANSIASGDIVEGEHWIPPIDKDESVINFYVGLITKHKRLDEEFKEEIRNLFRHKKAGNYTALEIFRAMKDKELATNNRRGFILYLDEAITNYEGPVKLVEDFPDDPGNYKVTIDPNTMQVMATDKSPEKLLDGMKFKGLDNPEERAAALENALE